MTMPLPRFSRDTPQSDKMKSKGKQAATCFDKDQSVHLFALP